jgi:hypothetical protein
MSLSIDVKIKSSQLLNDPEGTLTRHIQDEALKKFEARMMRGGKGLGARRNVVRGETRGLELTMHSTRRSPRTTGKAWAGKQVAILGSMAPRVMRSLAKKLEQSAAMREGWK